MNWCEEVHAFTSAGERLIGVICRPDRPRGEGFVVVVGGPQYRAGSHRQFVSLARSLAGAGFPVLRFDCRGMGDSNGELRNFELAGPDIGAAIDALMHAVPAVERVALWGLCDGASASLLYLHEVRDPRVAGLCLLNPWVRSETSLAKTQVKHYYRQRLTQRAFWHKLARGEVAGSAFTGLWRNLRTALASSSGTASEGAVPFQQRMAHAWTAFDGPRLLLMSECDYTAREFDQFTTADTVWRGAIATRRPERVALEGADHTCSSPEARRAAEQATIEWALRALATP